MIEICLRRRINYHENISGLHVPDYYLIRCFVPTFIVPDPEREFSVLTMHFYAEKIRSLIFISGSRVFRINDARINAATLYLHC